jgi:hypothetical protein
MKLNKKKKNTESLNIKRIPLSDQIYHKISKCKYLQHLEITLSNITNKALSSVLMNCNYLRTLILSGDSKAGESLREDFVINDNAFTFLKNCSENISSCTTLQFVDFSGLQITSKTVKWITKVATGIQSFNLSNCYLLGFNSLIFYFLFIFFFNR